MKTGTCASIDDYVRAFSGTTRAKLEELRRIIRQEAPQALEKISYQIPTFFLNGNLVHFAAYAHHIGFYPGSSGILRFRAKLTSYKTAKGSVQFPLEEPLPTELIRQIVRYRVAENTGTKKAG